MGRPKKKGKLNKILLFRRENVLSERLLLKDQALLVTVSNYTHSTVCNSKFTGGRRRDERFDLETAKYVEI